MLEGLLKTDNQREKFRTIANKLLNHCFIVKNSNAGFKNESRNDYFFILQNRKAFEDAFDLFGYDLLVDEIQNVIGIRNRFGTGRLQLGKTESILLLILRVLYLEKKNDLSQMVDEVVVTMQEINDKYNSLDVKGKNTLDKITEQNFVKLFRRYNLIDNLDSDVNQSDTRIIIYPSILMAVPVENINRYYELQQSKLEQYKGDSSDGNDTDEEDSEEA